MKTYEVKPTDKLNVVSISLTDKPLFGEFITIQKDNE